MNGVAKQFWSEVYDLRTPPAGDGGRPRRTSSRSKRRGARKHQPRKQDSRAA